MTNKITGALQTPRARSRFDVGIYVADLIHEIRNPLNGIDTTLQLLIRHIGKNHTQEDPVMLSYAENLRQEVQRIHTTLLDTQTFLRADFQLAPIEIRSLLGEVLKTAPLNDEIQGIHVKIELPEDLPCVRAHDKLLQRAFSNLIKNAIEAMPGGGDLIIRAYARNHSVVVEVTDSGVGIPEDLKIFKAFTTSKPGGMGLGLSIVQRIVSALGGRLAYSSQPGSTTFRLTLSSA